MNVDGNIVMLDTCTKFNKCISLSGWFHNPVAKLSSIDFEDPSMMFKVEQIGRYHGGVAELGMDKGFDIQVLMSEACFPKDALLIFRAGPASIKVPLIKILAETQQRQTTALSQTFFDKANASDVREILDVGGRARSQVDRSHQFPDKRVTVLDVLPGDNVTVVGDAHEMSSFLPREHFDAFLSVSVFEHLLMPWKVAIEINRVLKNSAFGMVHTHQTLGMHDMPWDFWRFSDTAWDAIFNCYTGFEIVERALTHPSYILPFVYRDDKATVEQALGFEGSSLLVRKIGPPKVSWDVKVADVTQTIYPSY